VVTAALVVVVAAVVVQHYTQLHLVLAVTAAMATVLFTLGDKNGK